MKILKNKKGFTMIELIVVIAILGILSVLTVTSFDSVRTKAIEAAFDMEVRTLKNAAMLFIEDYPNTATTWSSFAGQKADKSLDIESKNIHDTWNLYLDAYPQDPTRGKGSTFMVEITEDGEINISPDTYGHKR